MDNQQNDLATIAITIKNLEFNTTESGKAKASIEAEPTDGGKYGAKFTVWKLKSDGSETKAWVQMQSARYQPGDRVGITYSEREGVNATSGKAITYRTIVGFTEAGIAQPEPKLPTQHQSTAYKSAQPGISVPKAEQRDSYDAEGRVRHGFAIEAYKLGKQLNGETKLEIHRWVKFVMDGDFMAEGQGSGKSYVEPEDGKEISVEEIPF